MKVRDSLVCLDCDELFPCRLPGPQGHVTGIRGECPACGSLSLWPVSKWIKPLHGERKWSYARVAERLD